MSTLRFLLWQIFGGTRCPWHRVELMEHGFWPNARYSCSEAGCRINGTSEVRA